ncbi:hypothetical protein FFF34_001355 [Inquilinus sp. KBS0705]|nr:hypothetical protein FFF34_001355 [Inquilinus sp. KBS0705]
MKKPALLTLGLILIAFISVYFIIPQWIKTNNITQVDTTDENIAKFLVDKHQWQKWWPGEHSAADSNEYSYKGVTYILQKATNSDMQVQIKTGDLVLDSHLTYLAIDDGATKVTWYAQMQSSTNPFTRIAEFIRIKNTANGMTAILENFKRFMQTDTNVYGIKVNLKKINDPILLAKNMITPTYPTTAIIYKMIADLKLQIKAKGVNETNKPMLNITPIDNEYHVMAAIPINKTIVPDTGTVINNMVKGGNILEADVKGGRGNIDNAFQQLKNYQKDHALVSPAMPFELIITDRIAEPDTAKWITQIYWPIF